jgi:hypothetical protein
MLCISVLICSSPLYRRQPFGVPLFDPPLVLDFLLPSPRLLLCLALGVGR